MVTIRFCDLATRQTIGEYPNQYSVPSSRDTAVMVDAQLYRIMGFVWDYSIEGTLVLIWLKKE